LRFAGAFCEKLIPTFVHWRFQFATNVFCYPVTWRLLAICSFNPARGRANTAAALAISPEADALIYVSPQRILNEAAPRVMPPAEMTKMRASFADIKKSAGIDPATVEYLVIAVRFHKPAAI
jgi:hypothetical protein